MTTDIKRLAATGMLALTFGVWALPVLAVAPLEGRTITGARVDAYDPSAVMIYDPNADLTWLRDWSVNGRKPWVDQLVWASNVQMGSFANWSLPTARNQDGSSPCYGECTGNQMAYLWYEVLGNTWASFTNAGPFQNMHGSAYWTGTQYAQNPGNAWYFDAYWGIQADAGIDHSLYAVAVRPGDVAAPVPEPQTWAMLLMGLGAVTVALRRRPA